MTFKEYSKLYIEINKNLWKPSYLDKQLGIVNNRFGYFNNMEITDIKVSHCKIWYKNLIDVGAKSKRHYMIVLRGILDVAFYDDIIPKNPALHVKEEIVSTPDIKPFSADNVKKIIDYARNYNFNFQYFLAMGFYTGMRTGEILALKSHEVDLEKRVICINSTRSRHGENEPKTKKSKRVIPILNNLYPIIKQKKKYTDNYMLFTQYGKPYRDTYVFSHNFWTPMLKTLNFEHRRLYDMRHTYATNMLYRNAVTPVQLAQLLGHSSTKMIYEVYVKYLQSNLNDFDRSINVYS